MHVAWGFSYNSRDFFAFNFVISVAGIIWGQFVDEVAGFATEKYGGVDIGAILEMERKNLEIVMELSLLVT